MNAVVPYYATYFMSEMGFQSNIHILSIWRACQWPIYWHVFAVDKNQLVYLGITGLDTCSGMDLVTSEVKVPLEASNLQ